MMTYKGYVGVAEFDADANGWHGRVAAIRDVVTFEAESIEALSAAFIDSVEDYLAFCVERSDEPDRPTN